MHKQHIRKLPLLNRLRATGAEFERKRQLAVAKESPGFHSLLTGYAMMSREQRYWRRMATLFGKKAAMTKSFRLKHEYATARAHCEEKFEEVSIFRTTIGETLKKRKPPQSKQ